MALTITWNDGVNTPTVYTFSDDVVTALDVFRRGQQVTNTLTGTVEPKYPTVQAMVVSMLGQSVVGPAMANTPPSSVTTARQALAEASAAYNAAMLAAVTPTVT